MKVIQNIENEKKTFYKIHSLTWRTPLYNKSDRLEKMNKSLRMTKEKINTIKENSIKDFVYSNRQIPSSWKGKYNYCEQVRKMLANDDIFLAYIGNMYKNNKIKKKIGDVKLYSSKTSKKKKMKRKK